jgi:DME family drug/metabolite transporter
VLWGTVGAAQEIGAPDASPVAVSAVRSLLGGVGLLLLVGVGSSRRLGSVWRTAPRPLVVGAVAITAFQVGYLGGIRLNGVAVGTLLAIGSAPVWAGLLEAIGGRRPSRTWALATVLTVAGTALLVLPAGEVTADPVGVAGSLLAGLSYAGYTVASKRLLERGADAGAAIAWTFTVSGALLAPALWVTDLRWIGTVPGAVTVAWLGIAATAVAYLAFLAGLRGVDAPTATTLTLAEPLTGTLIAVSVLAERLGVIGGTGALLVVVGLALAGRRAGGRRTREALDAGTPPAAGPHIS